MFVVNKAEAEDRYTTGSLGSQKRHNLDTSDKHTAVGIDGKIKSRSFRATSAPKPHVSAPTTAHCVRARGITGLAVSIRIRARIRLGSGGTYQTKQKQKRQPAVYDRSKKKTEAHPPAPYL